ncbi:MAG TPA: ATP-dependent DNA helicase RecQ [Chitinophagaceae bacterium]|nr:ATP-dependent DNA helicase RecQ [Chitinophagaceae bacterium]
MDSILSILKKYWGYDSFKTLQEDIIHHVLEGKDTLALLPTGGGKSICYQVPAIVFGGICLVVSPLIALMIDQVNGLKRRGISAVAIHNGLSKTEVENIYEQIENGDFQLVYVSPERLQSNRFLNEIEHWNITLLSIDEAHCISQWGYDFRPPYLSIASIRNIIGDVPVLALTASATPAVQKDIIEKLAFRNFKVFFSTFQRNNISISAFKIDGKIEKLIRILINVKGSKIIYCNSRKKCVEVSTLLNKRGFQTQFYHAGLSNDERNKIQNLWIKGHFETIVCTNAFGMGIDKEDVRLVAHFDMPTSPEAYYQEIGRAGRDGQKSYAVLLYNQLDLQGLQESVALKYPPKETIIHVYESLAYYYQIEIGSGAEMVFDFDLKDFCTKFKLNILETLNALKILEQQSYITLSESVFLPSTAKVICSKSQIEHLEKHLPELDEVLKALLRMYGGIINHFMPIDELIIAQKLNVAMDYVQTYLEKIDAHHLIHYRKRKTEPQLSYLHDRIDTRFLIIDMSLVNVLKKRYIERIEFMKEFVSQTEECRQKRLVHFFGEEMSHDCRICDTCLGKAVRLSENEFIEIKNSILQNISAHHSLNTEELYKNLKTFESQKYKKVIQYLLDKKTLSLNEFGELILKNG